MGSAHHSRKRERPIMFGFAESRFKSYYSSHKNNKRATKVTLSSFGTGVHNGLD